MIYTYWYCWNKKTRKWEYNHREKGRCCKAKPIPKSELQKSWKSKKWVSQIYY